MFMDEDCVSALIRIGLFFGSLFQLFCIGSAIYLAGDKALVGAGESSDNSKHTGEATTSNVRRLYKLRKQEKKKRR